MAPSGFGDPLDIARAEAQPLSDAEDSAKNPGAVQSVYGPTRGAEVGRQLVDRQESLRRGVT